mmetsp:Transcript_31420/g.69981  ORF Transcript_31420/g.69981 Transcript_31420/m.69981 type:complete len:124 (-) Transcript_31420:364-735(-)|eukprot:CAMPEP_0202890976 /NCGR_PEP_ID=MMETSP1392-20130828/1197_1 /ASSEMBLY_ACC=CAM_ASM_000868 /TAXON_ID=225041 /ORGANISM="Chlamydomonas chlamydogama, Strain SAG 11-48b" /LENGTH=123 /DNA_ID=CAMNT_0049574635 /DNA_START=113 /DNA_END=484 /DNA_ORIENTATION=+
MRSRTKGYEQLPVQSDEPVSSSTSSKKTDLSQYKLDDLRFEQLRTEVPVGSIVLAIFLMVFGICSFIVAWLHATQQLLGKQQAEIGFTIIGFMTFIPGWYHCRIAYYTWRGYRGYSFDRIPRC